MTNPQNKITQTYAQDDVQQILQLDLSFQLSVISYKVDFEKMMYSVNFENHVVQASCPRGCTYSHFK